VEDSLSGEAWFRPLQHLEGGAGSQTELSVRPGVRASSLPDTRGGKRTTGFGWEGVVPNPRRKPTAATIAVSTTRKEEAQDENRSDRGRPRGARGKSSKPHHLEEG